MKRFFLTIFCLALTLLNTHIHAQRVEYLDIRKYTDTIIGSTFEDFFEFDEAKEDFKKLREYLKDRNNLLDQLSSKSQSYYYSEYQFKYYETKIRELEELLKSHADAEKIPFNEDQFLESGSYNQSYIDSYEPELTNQSKVPILKTKSELTSILNEFKIRYSDAKDIAKKYNNLQKNIEIVKQDIYLCSFQIESTLAPEYKRQKFRTDISLYFTILIGFLLFVFFFIVYQKSDKNLSKELLSGNGLQFITLFVLIIAIILFGILSILQGSELAAILAGISGYILGKGVPVDNTKKNIETPKPVPAPIVPPPIVNPPL